MENLDGGCLRLDPVHDEVNGNRSDWEGETTTRNLPVSSETLFSIVFSSIPR
jgi:hypothetical protein